MTETFTLDKIQKGLRHWEKLDAPFHIGRGKQGAMIAILNEACGSDHGRKLVLAWCFPDLFPDLDSVSSKRINQSQWHALFRWIDPQRVRVGHWRSRRDEAFKQECSEIWMLQMERSGAMKIRELTEEELAVES